MRRNKFKVGDTVVVAWEPVDPRRDGIEWTAEHGDSVWGYFVVERVLLCGARPTLYKFNNLWYPEEALNIEAVQRRYRGDTEVAR